MKDLQNKNIEALRAGMASAGIAAAIIPQADPHMGEYLADHWQVRRWLSGFTGSAGTLVITADAALLWTDSRYFIQAAQQLEGSGIELMKDGLASTPSVVGWLGSHLPQGAVVGIDGMLLSVSDAEDMRDDLAQYGLTLDTSFDIIDSIWIDRPALPQDKVFVHDIRFTGCRAADKIASVLAEMSDHRAESIFISALDEIAWLLNIRSSDVRHNPVATAFLYLSPGRSVLFIAPEKLDSDTISYLASEGVTVQPYGDALKFISALPAGEKVLVDLTRTTITVRETLGDRAVGVGMSPVALPKACKNEVQIEGIRRAMVRDGVALVKAFMEIERRVKAGEPTTELDVVEIVHDSRAAAPEFVDDSFGCIAGYAAHGAIVHYEATAESNSALRAEGLLLVDSGAQYPDGTTDITRTISLGEATDRERRDFTLVMKGHIALAEMVFPDDTRGAQLDAIARQFLWKHGMSYLHGTGHGVGHFLGVHEGPQSIRLNYVNVPLAPGMITSNEPGVYVEGIHGIRCENLTLCVPAMTTELGRFLRFETLTLFPFDRKLFDTTLMTDDEIAWVNAYHARVASELMSALENEPQRMWLAAATAPIVR